MGVGGSIVHQDVDAAKRNDSALNELLHGLAIACVGGHCQRLSSIGPYLLGDGFKVRQFATGQHNPGAGLSVGQGDGTADATRGAGNEGDFATEIKARHVNSGYRERRSPDRQRRRFG